MPTAHTIQYITRRIIVSQCVRCCSTEQASHQSNKKITATQIHSKTHTHTHMLNAAASTHIHTRTMCAFYAFVLAAQANKLGTPRARARTHISHKLLKLNMLANKLAVRMYYTCVLARVRMHTHTCMHVDVFYTIIILCTRHSVHTRIRILCTIGLNIRRRRGPS